MPDDGESEGFLVTVTATFTYRAEAKTEREARENLASWMENCPEDMLASEHSEVKKWRIDKVEPGPGGDK